MEAAPFLIVKKTRNGSGVFTTRHIKQNENIFKVEGVLKTISEIESEGVQSPLSANSYRFNKTLYLSPKGTLGDFLNHSCEPNAYVKKNKGELFIKANKDINAESEILIDYSTIIASDDQWWMLCNCTSKTCRGKIGKFIELPKDIQERYLKMDIVPDYILKI